MKKKCISCNFEIEEDVKFCPNCGSLMESISEKEKPVRLNRKIVLTSIVGLLVACILGVTIFKVIDSRKVVSLLYVKDGELRYGTGKEDDSYELLDEFATDGSAFEDFNESYFLSDYIKLSSDHQFIFYPAGRNLESLTYYWRDLSKLDKEDEITIDNGINSYEYAQI